MPALPQYQRQTAARGDTSPTLARVPSTAGSGIGEGLSGFAAGVVEMSRQINAERRAESLDGANRSVAEFSAWQREQLDVLATKPATEFEEHRKAFEAEAEKARSKLMSSSRRPETRQWIESQLAPLDERAGSRLRELTAVAMTGQKLDNFDATIAARAQAAWHDPDGFLDHLAGVLSGIQGSGVQMQTQAAYGAKARDELALAATRGYIQRNAAWAATELANPETKVAAFRNLDAKMRQQALQTATAAASTSRVTAEVGRIATAYERDLLAGNKALSQLSPTLSEAEQLEVRRDVQTRLNLLQSERQAQFGPRLAEIVRSVNAGTAGRPEELEIATMYRRSGLSQSHYETLLQRIDDARAKGAADRSMSQEFLTSLQSGMPIDPKNDKVRKAYAATFALDTAGATPGDLRFNTAALSWASRTKALADPAAAWLRAAVRSPDDAVAAAAGQFYGRLQIVAPDAASDLDADTRAFAGAVNTMVEAGTPPDVAVRSVREAMNAKPDVLERRRVQYTEHAKQNDAILKGLASRDFDGGWFESAPALTEQLGADFAGQTRRYFERTGDITQARDLAWQDLKRIYGVSEVNGQRALMPFPPERFGVTPAEVRQELADWLKANPQADGSTVDDLTLVPDGLTLRSVSSVLAEGDRGTIGYKILTRSGDLAVSAAGAVTRWELPTGDALEKRLREAEAKAKAASDAEVAKARRQREAWLEFQADPKVFAPVGAVP